MTNEEAKMYWLNHESVDDKGQSEAVWAAIKALEKQIPMKPKPVYNSYETAHCPICDHCVAIYDLNHERLITSEYCSHCGQRLDWGKENG